MEKKIKPAEDQIDSHVWKSKQPQVPPTLPGIACSGQLGRPGGRRRGFSTPAHSYNDKKGYDNLNRLQLLIFITQTQPSSIVWGKSWKFNKSLPPPEEGAAATSEWGKCWMFATRQPYSEAGKPWLNGPNMMDPQSLHLWKKPDYREVESQKLDVCLPTEEWKMSWRKSDKNDKEDPSVNGENVPKSGLFTLLMETQHNEASSEWSKSWRTIKLASQIPNCGQMNESIANEQDKDRKMSSEWEECWRLVNHHGCNKSKLPQVQKSHSQEWADSWRAAMVVFNNHKNSDPSLMQDHSDTYNDRCQQKESHLHNVILVSHEPKYRDLYLQLCNEFKAVSEWSKSWQVTKNNSKPCEEIQKVLKVSLSRLETTLEKVEKNTNRLYSASETTDPCYEQLKYNEIYHPKREFRKNIMLHLKQQKNVLSAAEWRDSWKTLKHTIRMERRRMTPDPLKSFRSSEKGGDMKPTTSEWKDSWKFTCQPLGQEPELWQQGWSTMPQIRVDRARGQNHFTPVELPKNGPTGERSWGESWKFLSPQHQSGPRHCRTQSGHVRSSVASHHPNDSLTHSSVRHRGHAGSVSDWQEAWMVSDTQFHQDKPSLTQWREAWKWSFFNTENWNEQLSRANWVDVLMEIEPGREKVSLQRVESKMSRSFDNQMFRERYPEKQWSASWRAGTLLNHQQSHYRTSATPGKSMSSTTQQQRVTANGHGSKWGMSFRLANPMPHVEQPWVESSSNSCHYTVMWSKGKNMQNNINNNFSNNHATFRLWGNSHQFLQGVSAQIKDKTKSKEPVDPRVIITKKTKTIRHLYSNIEKEKQSQRKWAGCHLLGKTQPRPKKGPASVKKLEMDDKNKFLEEWAESWRYLIGHGILKMKMSDKSLSGWDESWKSLLPLYQPMNSPKAK